MAFELLRKLFEKGSPLDAVPDVYLVESLKNKQEAYAFMLMAVEDFRADHDLEKFMNSIDHLVEAVLKPQKDAHLFSIEAEQSVLGALMLDNSKYKPGYLLPFHFYREDHQIIYAALVACAEQQKPMDVLSVQDFLPWKSYNEAYLFELCQNIPSSVNFEKYAQIVKNLYFSRAIQEKRRKENFE